MLNFEKCESEILSLTERKEEFAVNKKTGKVVACSGFPCLECLFKHGCGVNKIKWLYSEYKEPIKITKAAKTILENINPKFKWIAKDENGIVCIYNTKPRKEGAVWVGDTYASFYSTLKAELFDFLNWSDEEPTNIQELLMNCVVIDK